jgi:hypothetical protein
MANILVRWLITTVIFFHPFFVSVVQIDQNTKEKSLEISVRIFAEDLEATLKKFGNNTKLDLQHPTDKAAVDKLVNAYLQSKLQLKVDGKPVAMHYIGYEQRLESIWVYLEVENVTSLKKLDVNCNLLYEFEQKQANIIHVKAAAGDKSFKLDNPKTSTSFEF